MRLCKAWEHEDNYYALYTLMNTRIVKFWSSFEFSDMEDHNFRVQFKQFNYSGDLIILILTTRINMARTADTNGIYVSQ